MSPDRGGADVIDLRDDIQEVLLLTERAAGLARDLWLFAADDGELSIRLVEASHALHKAVIALSNGEMIG